MRKQLRFFPAIFWLIAIVILSGYPGDKVPKVPIWQFDKFIHSIIYLILSVTLIIAFYSKYNNPKNQIHYQLLIVSFGIFYGGIMEILQHYIFINRSGNWYDFIANSIGSLMGILIFPFIIKLLPINRWFKL